jgi:hypothetical protein
MRYQAALRPEEARILQVFSASTLSLLVCRQTATYEN